MMVGGYLSTIILTLVPPLWFHLMAPKLAQWDRDYATDEERRLLAQAGWRQDADSAGSGPVAAGAVGHA
jgi:alkane 1-monooxygenase